MHEEPSDIEQLQWIPLPPDLEDGLQNRSLSKRQLRNWNLVLQSRQIPCRSDRLQRDWQLLVPPAYYQTALDELRSFERNNRNWPPPPPAELPQRENTATTIWVLIGLGLFHILCQKQFQLGHTPVDWYLIGNADSGKILAGQWWRLFTALTLHSGGIHLASNIIVGGIFVNRLCRDLGSGLGWSLVLLCGGLGNFLNALVQNPAHRSIGASTAVFGAVGLLAAINMLRYRSNLRNRWPLPVAAAFGLLALLGTSGENTDIGAHLFGFLSGILFGLAYGSLAPRKPVSGFLNLLLAVLSAGLLVLSWWLALRSV